MIPSQAALNSTVSTKAKMLTPEGGREDELANTKPAALVGNIKKFLTFLKLERISWPNSRHVL